MHSFVGMLVTGKTGVTRWSVCVGQCCVVILVYSSGCDRAGLSQGSSRMSRELLRNITIYDQSKQCVRTKDCVLVVTPMAMRCFNWIVSYQS